jgi:gluconate 5-dehydrogenase
MSTSKWTPKDLPNLDGRTVLITGATSGIGRAAATELAGAGARVVMAVRNTERGGQIASELGGGAEARKLDLTDLASVRAFADGWDGPIDILINNAGINRRGAIEDLSEEDFDAVMDTNVKGVFLACRAFLPKMRERGWGRVVNLASILGTVGMAQRVPYASSKAAVANMTRVLGLEFATTGVTVNAIAPGPFATEMNRSLLDDPVKYKAFVEKIPMGRWGELHELAGAVVFLASNASSFVTGSILHVDGGWTAQ